MPWYIKLFLAAGGAGALWAFVYKGIPQLFAWLTPKVVHATALFAAYLLAQPWFRSIILPQWPKIKPAIEALVNGGIDLIRAAEAELEKDIDAAGDAGTAGPIPHA